MTDDKSMFSRRVIIESPYSGNRALNVAYAHAAMRDCLMRGESPYASHLMFTGALSDDVPEERWLGMRAALEWYAVAHATVVYTDLGTSSGMVEGINAAKRLGRPVEYRELPEFSKLIADRLVSE